MDVFIDAAESLGAYQLALEVTDGDAGNLDLEGRLIDTTRTDYVFRNISSTELVVDVGGHVAAFRDDGRGSSFSAPSYLGTLQFRASPDALGVFNIGFQNEEENLLLDSNGSALTSTFTIAVSVNVLCDDGNPCTDDLLENGICTHVNDDTNTCTDGNDCTSDACVSGVCTSTNEAVGTACDDGLFCTATDECDGSGTCVGSGDRCGPRNPACCEDNDTCGPFPCI